MYYKYCFLPSYNLFLLKDCMILSLVINSQSNINAYIELFDIDKNKLL